MSEAEFGDFNILDGGGLATSVCVQNGFRTSQETRANAHLITASPKMLELIEMLADEYQKEGFSMKVWVAAARSVSAQARGKL